MIRSHLSRRQLLQLGGVGMLGLSLPRLLKANAQPTNPRREKSCIFIVQYGGASHHDSWDLKPDAPDDIRGPYRPIATSVPGMRISELHTRMATLTQHFSLIRSMT